MIYGSLERPFFEDVDALVFIYDINESSSLRNIKQWKGYVEKFNQSGIMSWIVGNKADLYDQQVYLSIYSFKSSLSKEDV